MSLPVLHSLAGYGLSRLAKKPAAFDLLLAVACILLANMADFDFLPGVILGNAVMFHRGATHSLFASVLCGAACAWIFSRLRSEPFKNYFFICTASYASHLALDFFGKAPKGLMLMWPFSSELFFGPLTDFTMNIHDHPLERADGFASFFAALAHPSMIRTLCFELTLVFFFLAVAAVFSTPAAYKRERETLVFTRCAMAAVFFATSVLIS